MPFPYAIGGTTSSTPSDRPVSSDLLGEFVSGSRGGLAATTPHSPTGEGPLLEMVYIPVGAEVCGGLIGSQQLLCAEKNCSIQSHRLRAVSISDSSLYIIAPSRQGRRTVAMFRDPCAEHVSLGEELMDWLLQEKTLERHRRALTLLNEMTTSEIGDVTLESFVDLVSRQGAVGKTPAPKKRSLTDMFDSIDSGVMVLGDQMTLSPVLEAKFDGGSDDFLEENWPKLQAALSSLLGTVEKVASIAESKLPELGIQINEMDAALLSLKGTLGTWNPNRSATLYGATLFSIVDGLAEAVQEMDNSLKLVRASSVDSKLSVTVDSLTRVLREISAAVGNPDTGLASLGAAVKDLALWSQKADLRMMGLELQDSTGNFMDTGHGAAAPPGPDQDLLDRMDRRIEALELLTERGSGDFVISGCRFKRLEDAFDWITRQGPAGAISSGWLDVFSLADFAGLGTSFKEQLADRKRVCDSKLQVEGSEILILASFGPEYPSVFGEYTNATDKHPLPKAKSFREWYNSDETSGCVFQQWQKAGDQYARQIYDAELKQQAWRGPAALGLTVLAEQFQLKTTQFMLALQASITTFYDKMVNDDGTSPEEAWLLVSRMLQAIFRKLSDARAVAGRPLNSPFATLDDRMRRSARVLWGTYECHRVMQDIMQVGFNRHPVIIPAQTLALYSMKAGKGDLDKLSKRLKTAEDSLRPLAASDGRVSQSKVNSLESAVSALKGENKSLKDTLQKIERRLKTLEGSS